MKAILVAVEPGDGLESTLRLASLAAHDLRGHVEGVCVALDPAPVLVASGDGLAAAAAHQLIDDFHAQGQDRLEQARTAFVATMAAAGLPDTVDGRAGPASRWREAAPVGPEDLARVSCAFDVIVIGRPVRGRATPSISALEAVLFSSGRPLLIAPPEPSTRLAKTVVVAWKNSAETARTLGLAGPVLAAAETVHVLGVADAGPDPSVDEVTAHLRLNGIAAHTAHRESAGRALGPAILDEAAVLGADLLVKGAYTQSRLSQLIFGGATRHILSSADLPVFMAH